LSVATGRFYQKDDSSGSLAAPVTLHRYVYANDNPVGNIDPRGTFSLAVEVATYLIEEVLSKTGLFGGGGPVLSDLSQSGPDGPQSLKNTLANINATYQSWSYSEKLAAAIALYSPAESPTNFGPMRTYAKAWDIPFLANMGLMYGYGPIGKDNTVV